MRPVSASRPWLSHYGEVPPTLDYPQVTMVDAVMASVRRTPDAIAYDFLGTTATYRELGGRSTGARTGSPRSGSARATGSRSRCRPRRRP